VAVDVEPVRHLDLAAGPDGKPVAIEEYQLAYWTAPAKGRFLMRAAHGASGDLPLGGPCCAR
jgi:hypothetical protein